MELLLLVAFGTQLLNAGSMVTVSIEDTNPGKRSQNKVKSLPRNVCNTTSWEQLLSDGHLFGGVVVQLQTSSEHTTQC